MQNATSNYSYCRADGTRRRTKGGVTKTESCQQDWKPWELKEVRPAISTDVERCGCATCTYQYTCPENNCGPRDDLTFTRSCNVKFCAREALACLSPNAMHVVNKSSSAIYVILQDSSIINTFALQPQDGCNVGYSLTLNINVGIVGNLSSATFFTGTPGTGIVRELPNLKAEIFNGNDCGTLQFYDEYRACDNTASSVTVPDEEKFLLETVQSELNAFLKAKTFSEINTFLSGATVYFAPKDSTSKYFKPNVANGKEDSEFKEGFQLVEGLTPTRYKWTSLTKELFQLHTLSANLLVRVVGVMNRGSDIFQLNAYSSLPKSALRTDVLKGEISFYPHFRENQQIGFGSLPFAVDGLYPGLDGVTMIIESLSKGSRDAFLDASVESARQCCDLDVFSNYGIAVCNDSKYSAREGNYANCDKLVDTYCNATLTTQDQKDFCSCYDGVDIPNPLQQQLITELKKQDYDLPRKCVVTQCKLGRGYKNGAMRKQECVGICLQIQNVIAKGELQNIDFKGIQTLDCGDGKPPTPPAGQDPEIPFGAKNNGAGAGLLSVGMLIAVVGIAVLFLLGKQRPQLGKKWMLIPAIVGGLLAIIGILFLVGVIGRSLPPTT
jgi:hypothetical protein